MRWPEGARTGRIQTSGLGNQEQDEERQVRERVVEGPNEEMQVRERVVEWLR